MIFPLKISWETLLFTKTLIMLKSAFSWYFHVHLLTEYRIYSKERLCLKERLPRISAPLLTWNIWWVPPSNKRPSFLWKTALFWKIVLKGDAYLESTSKIPIIQLSSLYSYFSFVYSDTFAIRHSILLLLLLFLLFDLRGKLKIFWCLFDIFNDRLPWKSASLE